MRIQCGFAFFVRKYGALRVGDAYGVGDELVQAVVPEAVVGAHDDVVGRVCRHCEFRRICPDCRVFTCNPQGSTAHPARCTYNPYPKFDPKNIFLPIFDMSNFVNI